MSRKHLNLVFPQWQGGGKDRSPYYGAKEFCELYLNPALVTEIAVDMEEAPDTIHHIFGYQPIIRQLQRAHDFLNQEAPDTLFTLGGSCDANIPPVAYLNRKFAGDMTVLWFDSHGDLNTPLSSPSKHFFGMPLRTLLGDGDDWIVGNLPSTLMSGQVVLMGARDLDPEEKSYIDRCAIPVLTVSDIEQSVEGVLDAVRLKGSRNLYIHIDLDVLEPAQFPYVPVPVPGGLAMDTLQTLLGMLNTEFNLVGLGVMEYKPTGKTRYRLFEEICKIGTGLSATDQSYS